LVSFVNIDLLYNSIVFVNIYLCVHVSFYHADQIEQISEIAAELNVQNICFSYNFHLRVTTV